MYICAKQAQIETRSPLVHPLTEKAIGVDLWVHRSSTPLDILRMGVARWTFVLGCVWLGHRVITNHVCAQVVTRSTSRKEGFGSGLASPLVPVQSRTGTHGGIYPGSCAQGGSRASWGIGPGS